MKEKYNALKNKKNNRFDTFLCHNSKDKSEVLELLDDLVDVEILPWLDVYEVGAGDSLVDVIGRAFEAAPSTVIVLGEQGFGPFQEEEYKNLMHGKIYNQKKIIPVILKNTITPDIPNFLNDTHRIDFREEGQDNLGKLYKSITGQELVRPRVFVAEVNPDTPLDAKRNELENFLRQFKITVLPQNSNLSDPNKVEKRIEDCLGRTDVFAQLLNAYGWLYPGTKKCLVQTQFACAQRLLEKEKIFLWCAPEEFENIQLEDNTRVTTCRFEDFKYQIRDAALQSVTREKGKTAKIKPKLFVRRDKADSELTQNIFRLLQKEYKKEPKVTVRYLRDFENSKEREEYLQKMIKECAITIIVYARCPVTWADRELDDSVHLQILLKRDRLPILIIKHPADKKEWVQDEAVTYVTYNDETDIKNLIDTIDKMLESANG